MMTCFCPIIIISGHKYGSGIGFLSFLIFAFSSLILSCIISIINKINEPLEI